LRGGSPERLKIALDSLSAVGNDIIMDENKPVMSGYRTRAELARELGITDRTLRRWDRLRIGPRKLKMGPRRIVYKVEDVRRWLDEGGQK